jgi:NAD(P)-dependent dehydrogenase (short-subunit alcohol dehydrogenase family)
MASSVLITGASSGFGRLTAETLARRGHRVFATMRARSGRNATVAAEFASFTLREGMEICVLDLDVTADTSVDAAVASVFEAAGRIDVLVNNAGTLCRGLLESITVDQAREQFETNVFGSLRLNRAVLPYMHRQQHGLIVHVSSSLGRVVLPYSGIYAASKFALEAIAEAYCYELAGTGIESVIVEPGAFPTDLERNAIYPPADDERLGFYGESASRSLRAQEGLSRRANPQKVADAIAMLVEMSAGQRPLRTTVGSDARRLDTLNEFTTELQKRLLSALGLGDMLPGSQDDSLSLRH